ncbi:inositol monophosphatase [Aquamicrobium sp. NLF2-7]|uniref:inositol monophosphatase family protein n=1 Tax=Aquamicrobium sp. NLF2-7 TaxID=2918753 RepID=UPI001EFA6C34|nr:inositol monophosphatase [Aquamicrobium sp. NLF2-7]MCG8273849.1 inositol monophosphatase [Aquamicrobium sp. NLF2-7]
MLPDTALQARLETARAVIRDAGALALDHFGRLSALQVEIKANGQDVVSQADRAVEKLVRERIAAAFPEDGFLGEETGLTPGASDYTWVVDPIDGTSCFLHDLRSWCVALALLKDKQTAAGLILDPTSGELFTAAAGDGAFLNGRPISVDIATDLQHGLTSVGANARVPPQAISGFVERLLGAGGMFVRSGSGALSLAHVACGRLAAYYEPHMNAWDCLAAQCIVREAGGWANDFLDESDLLAGGRVIACAPQLRAPLLDLIEGEKGRPA